jgi:hypothetical protein
MALVCQGQPTNVPPSGAALALSPFEGAPSKPGVPAWAGFLVFQIEQDQLGRLPEGTLGKRGRDKRALHPGRQGRDPDCPEQHRTE